MIFTEGLQTRFCGHGDEAAHTTFHGDVTVVAPLGATASRSRARSRTSSINFRPPTPRRAVLEARAKEGRRALNVHGHHASPTTRPPSGGLAGRRPSRPSSPANRADILPGDLIVSLRGREGPVDRRHDPERLASASPPSASSAATRPPVERQISLEGFDVRPPDRPPRRRASSSASPRRSSCSSWRRRPGIITWVERRVSARMQSRIGPNRAGPQGFLVWIADGIKSIMKEDIIPTESDDAALPPRALPRLRGRLGDLRGHALRPVPHRGRPRHRHPLRHRGHLARHDRPDDGRLGVEQQVVAPRRHPLGGADHQLRDPGRRRRSSAS